MKYIFFALIALTLSTTTVMADSGQYGQYGGTTPVQTIIIDKKVSKTTSTKGGIVEYVDNLSPQDARFIPGQKIYFQIKIKNISNTTIERVDVSDTLPSYVDAIEGPGSYDASSKTVKWSYTQLKAGEEKTEHITAQVQNQTQLPTDKGVICLINKAFVQSQQNTNDDTSQFCIEKQVALTKGGVPTKAPEAGPELGILLGLLNAGGLAAGFYLKKKSI